MAASPRLRAKLRGRKKSQTQWLAEQLHGLKTELVAVRRVGKLLERWDGDGVPPREVSA